MALLLQERGHGRVTSRDGVICPVSLPSGMVAVSGKDGCLRVHPVEEAREGLTRFNLPQVELNAIKTAMKCGE